MRVVAPALAKAPVVVSALAPKIPPVIPTEAAETAPVEVMAPAEVKAPVVAKLPTVSAPAAATSSVPVIVKDRLAAA